MEKKVPENKIIELIKKNLIAIALSCLVVAWTFVKDIFTIGADLKFKQKIELIITEDLKTHFDTIIDNRFEYNLKKSLQNPLLWYDALNSNYVSEYAEEKALEIRSEVSESLIEMDSINKNFIESIGKGLGIRNEKVLPLFQKMLRDYVNKQKPHTLTAPF